MELIRKTGRTREGSLLGLDGKEKWRERVIWEKRKKEICREGVV